jgi:hypothetical protein
MPHAPAEASHHGSHVDFATQERRINDSGRWYAELLRAHRRVNSAESGYSPG